MPLLPFLGEGSPTKIDYRKKEEDKSKGHLDWYPYSKLSTGGHGEQDRGIAIVGCFLSANLPGSAVNAAGQLSGS